MNDDLEASRPILCWGGIRPNVQRCRQWPECAVLYKETEWVRPCNCSGNEKEQVYEQVS